MNVLDKFLDAIKMNDDYDDDDDCCHDHYDDCDCGCDDDDCDCEDDYVEMTCPNCGEVVCFDQDILEADEAIEVVCPVCDGVVFTNDLEYTEPVDDEEEKSDSDCGCSK